jgi:hypothetical protein
VEQACPNSRRFDAILAENWDLMEAHAGAKLMPKPARRGPHAHRTLGCGYWGCVYETGQRDVVLKVTNDSSEPAFVLMVRKRFGEAWWPDGFVQYQDAIQLRGGDEPTFALWRERAYNVGATERPYRKLPAKYRRRWPADEIGFFYDALENYGGSASMISRDLAPHSGRKRRSVRLRKFQREIASTTTPDRLDSPLLFHWNNCVLSAEDMTLAHPGKLIGASLAELCRGFILPADIGYANIGDCPRGASFGLVVTDPGQTVSLHPDLLEVKVPLL